MAKQLSIVKSHQLSLDRARAAAQEVAEDLRRRFALEWSWDGDAIDFSRPGVEGRLTVGTRQVALECKLGFLFSALSGAIEAEVHKEFDKRFAAPTGH